MRANSQSNPRTRIVGELESAHNRVTYIHVGVLPYKGRFTWGPKSQVSLMLAGPNMDAKSQLLSLKKLLKYS